LYFPFYWGAWWLMIPPYMGYLFTKQCFSGWENMAFVMAQSGFIRLVFRKIFTDLDRKPNVFSNEISGVPVNCPLNRSIHGWNPVKSQCDPDSHSEFHRISVRKSPMTGAFFNRKPIGCWPPAWVKMTALEFQGVQLSPVFMLGLNQPKNIENWMTEVGHHDIPSLSTIWLWVKTLVPSEPQNSWDLWMFIPLKMVLIGIDP